MSGSRVALVTIVVAVLIAGGFHWLYADVPMTADLLLAFVLGAALCALAAQGVLRAVARARPAATPPTATPASKKEETS